MVGGVATSKGDFRCTKMVERCLVAGEEVPDAGENAAVVGGFKSSFDFPGPVSEPLAGDEVISAIQGVSDLCQRRRYGKKRKRIESSRRCPNQHTKRSHANLHNLGMLGREYVLSFCKILWGSFRPTVFKLNQIKDRVMKTRTSRS